VYLWRDTIWHLIANWSDIPSLGLKDSRRVLLITWLLTDPDLEPDLSEPIITNFEKMPTKKRQYLYHDIFILGGDRCQQWIDATRLSWHTIKIEKGKATMPPMSPKASNHKKTITRKCLTEIEHGNKTENMSLTIDKDRLEVSYKNKTFPITERQVEFLEQLAKKPGVWIPGSELKKSYGERLDKVKNKLPEPILELIESHTRNGYRLTECSK
jgi:hypothetical protein